MDPAGNLAAEQPELLNPYDDDTDGHIQVIADESDPKFGAVVAVNGSPKGKASIEIYGLNDDAKVRTRQLEMLAFRLEFKDAINNAARLAELLASLQEGKRQCSLACQAMAEALYAMIGREMKKAFRR